jgi:peptidoglycan/LPS O-acetylase OafA/YrhL
MTIPQRKYYPELDALRGFMCFLIIWQHCHLRHLNIPFTVAIVCLHSFFIISGYLITSILLKDKERNMPLGKYLKNYYLRRVFRIFPLYFTYIGLITFFSINFENNNFVQKFNIANDIKQNWLYLYTYTYNLKEYFSVIFNHPYQSSIQLLHLWSLSMEEQFYLVIPFLVYFLSLKNFKRLVVLLLVLSPIIRIFGYNWIVKNTHDYEFGSYILERHPLLQLDVIIFGAAIAVFDLSWIKKPRLWIYLGSILFFVYTYVSGYFIANKTGLPILQVVNQHSFIMYNGFHIFMYTFMNAILALLVYCLTYNIPVYSWILKSPFFIQAGKYSYGMYVFQMLIISIGIIVLYAVFPKFLHKSIIFEIASFGFVTILSYFSAKVSYQYFESYFLKFKDKYM